ncbi:MAG: bifunctional 5,10-methylene-tetrahydrofolate dehydrogenase/5,10-methylene-tetrahydrofolate cyclohydrolase [Parasporobacterium sp.]|nr:bifunctional 5,10-methylene-tetrahydrofolate dehydrogenase/5,10-methylene-tetrahydrofolate cyclohydrolase [Oscillospiraceae bacterium]MBR3642251.1 bifunctional 5,10-methylene-tetrahydrofolate dehydrogenase/5,10-methylene-tetrahydrofolate cyclohydrolase [Parasporobacterium sp.]
MATILDGKVLAASIRLKLREEAALLPRRPGIAVILVGDDPASQLYVKNKAKDCEECGFLSRRIDLPDTVSEEEILGILNKLNAETIYDGVLVQLPLPAHISEKRVIEAIAPEKDVDAFHPLNVGRMVRGDSVIWPCTPAGIGALLDAYDISADGKVCVMVGRSNIVGKPMGLLLLRRHGTVIYCHRHTPDLAAMTRQADILVVAAGQPRLISGSMVKPGATVIDVAMNRDAETGRFTGDVCFDEVSEKAAFITPVPGGVGPMTRAMLMQNVLTLAKLHMGLL